MRSASNFRSVFAFTVLGAVLGLQGLSTGQKGEQPKPTPAPQEKPEKPEKPAGQPKLASVPVKAREIALPVKGLTSDNLNALREDLLAYSTQVYVCPSCSLEKESEGMCPKCKVALDPKTRPVFTAVGGSAQDGTLILSSDPRSFVRLSRVEATLGARSVTMDDERFTLSGPAQLFVQASAPSDPASIEKALTDAKLFDEVKAALDPATSQIVVTVRADSAKPTRAKVNAALQGAKARLTDVTWGPALPKS